MAKDVKSLDEGLQLLIRRNKKTNTKSVDDIRKALKEKTSIDLSTVTWNKDDAFVIPDEETILLCLFEQKVGEGAGHGIHVKLTNNACKEFFFSSVAKSAAWWKFDETTKSYVVDYSREPVESNTNLAVTIKTLDDHDKFLDFLISNAGKTIRVDKVMEVETCKRNWRDKLNNYPVIGLTKTRIPFFVLED